MSFLNQTLLVGSSNHFTVEKTPCTLYFTIEYFFNSEIYQNVKVKVVEGGLVRKSSKTHHSHCKTNFVKQTTVEISFELNNIYIYTVQLKIKSRPVLLKQSEGNMQNVPMEKSCFFTLQTITQMFSYGVNPGPHILTIESEVTQKKKKN